MVLSADDKRDFATAEMSFLHTGTGEGNIPFEQEVYVYNGNACTFYKQKKQGTIFHRTGDDELKTKLKEAKKGIRALVDRGFALPPDLCIYLTNYYSAQNRAFHRDRGWNQIAIVTLGPAAVQGGRADALSAQAIGGFSKPATTTIHEIGHNLHERAAGDAFWEDMTGQAAHGDEVSGYACQNKKEFVAEVFAGLILGRNYSVGCIQEYRNLNGPTLANFPP